jgi:hypothetical protein
MKKIIAIAALAFIVSCTDNESKTESLPGDSLTTADSAARNFVDTTKKMMNDAKKLVDTAAGKMEKAAMKALDTSNMKKK